MNEESVALQVLKEGLDDWVLVDDIIALSREVANQSGGSYKEVAMGVIERLLRRNEACLGVIGDSGFEDWEGTVEELCRRALVDLEANDWMPLGGSFWIRNTPEGDRVARQSDC
ncbi:hypothetical protein ACQPZU_16205 [Saccharomonospora azurea]|jgi:hypothetical protein|uniref:hypothetical protein n=1 Tax=Saccharomonospora azurea TaxID=40988 RepID=UPI00159D9F89|nr:hypothetical protein [Saccharomonospora azurea]